MIKLLNLISDGVIFQNNQDINIEGYAFIHQIINVLFYLEDELVFEQTSKCDQKGYFHVIIPKRPSSLASYSLEITCQDEILVVRDIKIGEVILMLGQSNAEYPFCLVKGNEQFKTISNPNIRYIRSYSLDNTMQYETYRPYDEQVEILTTGWKKADHYENTLICSGLGFYIAYLLEKELNVPIGIIAMAAGGTPIDSWLKRDDINHNETIKKYLITKNKYLDQASYNKQGNANYAQMCGLYNEKIYPIRNVNIKTAIWYQGEANAGCYEDAKIYKMMLETLLRRLRADFRNRDLPFILCNISTYQYGSHFFEEAYLNEVINDLGKEKNNYPIPVYDLPLDWLNGTPYFDWLEWHPIHPVDKFPLAKRIVSILLNNVLNANSRVSNTYFYKHKFNNDSILIEFQGSPLKKIEEVIRGFAVSDDSGIYYEAKVEIIGDHTLKVYSEYVKQPKDCTYGFFKYNEMCNLYNIDHIPVLPFRTKIEEIKDDNYYVFNKFLSCDYDKTFEICGSSDFGGAYYKDTWTNGTILSSKGTKITYDHYFKTEGTSSLKITYKSSPDTYYYFGASPNISVSGQIVPLKNYQYLSVDIASDHETTFYGLYAKHHRNQIIKFMVKDQIDSKLSKTYKRYTIDLTNAQTQYGSLIKKDEMDYDSIFELQLMFRSKQDCIVHIDHMVLHNEMGDEHA